MVVQYTGTMYKYFWEASDRKSITNTLAVFATSAPVLVVLAVAAKPLAPFVEGDGASRNTKISIHRSGHDSAAGLEIHVQVCDRQALAGSSHRRYELLLI